MEVTRKKFTENENILLYAEVEGICPQCTKELMYEKKKSTEKNYQIAHIYPLNATPEQKELLKDEELLSTDLNDHLNLICLCLSCHRQFDNPRTVEGYKEMVALKKRVLLKNKEKANWENHKIENEIGEILDFLATNETLTLEEDIITYDPKQVDDKADETLSILTKRKIKDNVEDYYGIIKKKFKEVDSCKPLTTEIISTQIKQYYLKMRQQYKLQNEIFVALVEWMHRKTNQKSKDACEIIVSYFVQNCEVF